MPRNDVFYIGIFIGEGRGKATMTAKFDGSLSDNLVALELAGKIDPSFVKSDTFDAGDVPDSLRQKYTVLGQTSFQYHITDGAKSYTESFYVVDALPCDNVLGRDSAAWDDAGDDNIHDASPIQLRRLTPEEEAQRKKNQEKQQKDKERQIEEMEKEERRQQELRQVSN